MTPFDGSNPSGESDSYSDNSPAAHEKFKQNQHAFMGVFPIETPRLRIREIEQTDVDNFHDIVTQPGFNYYYFDGSRAKTEAFVQEAIDGRSNLQKGDLRKSFMMAVERKDTGQLIGHVSIDILDKAPEDFDLAIFIDQRHQHKGFAREAFVGFLKEIFNTFALDRVVATVHPENYASQKLMRSIGFQDSGKMSAVDSANGQNERFWWLLPKDKFIP